MLRPITAFGTAVLATVLSAPQLAAQQTTAADAESDVPSAVYAPMSASRGPRTLLRNGWDYLKYGEYEKALKLFREAESNQKFLNPDEQKALSQGIERARRGMREARNAPNKAYAKSAAKPRPGALAVARPETAPSTASAGASAAKSSPGMGSVTTPVAEAAPPWTEGTVPAMRDRAVAKASATDVTMHNQASPAGRPRMASGSLPQRRTDVPDVPAMPPLPPAEILIDPATVQPVAPLSSAQLDPAARTAALSEIGPLPDAPAPLPAGSADPTPAATLSTPPAATPPAATTPVVAAPPAAGAALTLETLPDTEVAAKPDASELVQPSVKVAAPQKDPVLLEEPPATASAAPVSTPPTAAGVLPTAVEKPADASSVPPAESAAPEVPLVSTDDLPPLPDAAPSAPSQTPPPPNVTPKQPTSSATTSKDAVEPVSAVVDEPAAASTSPTAEAPKALGAAVAAPEPSVVPEVPNDLPPLPDEASTAVTQPQATTTVPVSAPRPETAVPAVDDASAPVPEMPAAPPVEAPPQAAATPVRPAVAEELPPLPPTTELNSGNAAKPSSPAEASPAPAQLAAKPAADATASAQPGTPPVPAGGDELPPLPAEELLPRNGVGNSAAAAAVVESNPAPVVRERTAASAPTLSAPGLSDSRRGSFLPSEIQEDVQRLAELQSQAIRRDGVPSNSMPNGTPGTSNRISDRLELPRAPSPTEDRPIRPIPVPEEFVPLDKREWEPSRKLWAATGLCHMPLYFQNATLERYGHSVEQFIGPGGRYLTYPLDDPRQSAQRAQLMQPFASAGLFAAQIVLLPYNLIMDPPWEAEYDLGYFRPGDRVPTDIYYLPTTGVGPPLRGANY